MGNRAAARHILHVAMPFTLPGDSATNVIRELVTEHTRIGGRSSVVLSDNRGAVIDGVSEIYVNHREIVPREYFLPREIRRDHISGLLGRDRRFTGRIALPAIRAAQEVKPDTVIVHEAHYASSTLPFWRRAMPDVQLVMFAHGQLSRAYRRRELERLLGACDDLVFVSRSLQDRTLAHAHPHSRSHVVLNGTRPKDVPAREPRAGRRPRVLFVGRILEIKGVHLLIDALHVLETRGMVVDASIIGTSTHGPTSAMAQYERDVHANAATLTGNVDFRGFVPRDELDHEYQAADIVCFPSICEEACGLVLLEGISNGAAVVTTRHGGIPEAGGDGVVYFDDRDPSSLADQLQQLLSDERALEAVRERARIRAEEITWEKQFAVLSEALFGSDR